jgi:MoxR-like ATPase
MGFLEEQLHLYGLQDQELAIIANMVIRHPVLLVGWHGSAKTELCWRLAAALYGVELTARRFRKYEAKNLDMTEMLGYADVYALRHHRGRREVGYVPSPISMATRWVVLIDEILVASGFTQNKLLELVRERTIQGVPTEVRYIFAATNPPSAGNFNLYDVNPGSLPLVDRFSVVTFPRFLLNSTTDRESLKRIIRHSDMPLQPGARPLRAIIKRARAKLASFSADDIETVDNLAVELFARFTEVEGRAASAVGEPLTTLSPRKTKVLANFLLAVEALRRTSPQVHYSLSCVTEGVLGMVPEATALCRAKIANLDKLRADVASLLGHLQLRDPLRAHRRDLLKLVCANVPDQLAWTTEVLSTARTITDPAILARAIVLVERRGLPGKMVGKDLRRMLARIVLDPKQSFTITRVIDAVEQALARARRRV